MALYDFLRRRRYADISCAQSPVRKHQNVITSLPQFVFTQAGYIYCVCVTCMLTCAVHQSPLVEQGLPAHRGSSTNAFVGEKSDFRDFDRKQPNRTFHASTFSSPQSRTVSSMMSDFAQVKFVIKTTSMRSSCMNGAPRRWWPLLSQLAQHIAISVFAGRHRIFGLTIAYSFFYVARFCSSKVFHEGRIYALLPYEWCSSLMMSTAVVACAVHRDPCPCRTPLVFQLDNRVRFSLPAPFLLNQNYFWRAHWCPCMVWIWPHTDNGHRCRSSATDLIAWSMSTHTQYIRHILRTANFFVSDAQTSMKVYSFLVIWCTSVV